MENSHNINKVLGVPLGDIRTSNNFNRTISKFTSFTSYLIPVKQQDIIVNE